MRTHDNARLEFFNRPRGREATWGGHAQVVIDLYLQTPITPAASLV
jgi:hypothetical protein